MLISFQNDYRHLLFYLLYMPNGPQYRIQQCYAYHVCVFALPTDLLLDQLPLYAMIGTYFASASQYNL